MVVCNTPFRSHGRQINALAIDAHSPEEAQKLANRWTPD